MATKDKRRKESTSVKKNNMYDIVIIGSGLGGLECGVILAKSGRSVLVLERAHHPGGCMQSYKRQGLAFDTGLHYVGGLAEGQSLNKVFRYLGLMDLPWKRLDQEFEHISICGEDFTLEQGYDPFVESLSQRFPMERKALEAYVGMLQHSERMQKMPLNPMADERAFDAELLDEGAYDYLQETFQDQRLINVLSAASMKMELRKESLPLFNFVHGNSGFIESSWRLQGDGSQLVNRLVAQIQASGGKVVCDSDVEELVEEDGQIVKANCANGESYEGKVFITDIHPAQACNLVRNSRRIHKAYLRRINSLENTFGMFTLSLVLKPGLLPYFNYNQYIYSTPDIWSFYDAPEPVRGIMVSCRVPEDGSRYATQVDIMTPMPWKECELWTNTSVGHRGNAYEEMVLRKAEECLALAAQKIPRLSTMIQQQYISTPLTYRDYLNAPQGTAFGLRKDYHHSMMTFLSPMTPVRNLLMTGQNLILHGVQGVTMTSLFTCNRLLDKGQIWNIIKE
ncbi:MAG: NAD(P)/FAD-dependent oxidoreductase [Prevotella sp.]|nr:NAD(P)/FAD-dependent oxidoreductase [Prevotella sp.]MCI2081492.1 NAD(P)/FAD-dependent oxidoreductase [Prevotella sp.]MCI2103384.1 NAD(P)/FAD-dependent oxidoreductase [Prevotella sp.]